MSKHRERLSNTGQVIIPAGHTNPPEAHEIEVAWILARHFGCVVEFLIPVDDYKRKTPDVSMLGLEWEIKSPKGNSRQSTVRGQFMSARGKSKHMIIDGRRTPLDDAFMVSSIRMGLRRHSSVKRLLYITKGQKVLDIK